MVIAWLDSPNLLYSLVLYRTIFRSTHLGICRKFFSRVSERRETWKLQKSNKNHQENLSRNFSPVLDFQLEAIVTSVRLNYTEKKTFVQRNSPWLQRLSVNVGEMRYLGHAFMIPWTSFFLCKYLKKKELWASNSGCIILERCIVLHTSGHLYINTHTHLHCTVPIYMSNFR